MAVTPYQGLGQIWLINPLFPKTIPYLQFAAPFFVSLLANIHTKKGTGQSWTYKTKLKKKEPCLQYNDFDDNTEYCKLNLYNFMLSAHY
jgi:hypothetical protein